jgi:ATP-dependent DNA ligase
MRSTFEFCLPSRATAVPNGPDWLHEVKYASRYPWIVEAARKIRQKRFVLDGEAVILGVDGIADFDALHFRQQDEEVQLCALNARIGWPTEAD